MYQIEKVDMRVKYTREWTFEALYQLLKNKEYCNIKISEIIIKAGISRATFYRNFNTKNDIIKIHVRTFFESFYLSLQEHTLTNGGEDELYLIRSFFEYVDNAEKLMDVVIKAKLEYLMVAGISELINIRKEEFYSLVKINKNAEVYTLEMVASSAWILLSRWHKGGKQETSSELTTIFSSAFKSIYIALYRDKSELNDG